MITWCLSHRFLCIVAWSLINNILNTQSLLTALLRLWLGSEISFQNIISSLQFAYQRYVWVFYSNSKVLKARFCGLIAILYQS